MPKFDWIKKVMVLGSGAIKIGEAAEFDYQAANASKLCVKKASKPSSLTPT